MALAASSLDLMDWLHPWSQSLLRGALGYAWAA